MVDLVFEEIERPRADLDWKTALRRRTSSVRDVLIRHPWALRILESRTEPGAGTLAPRRRARPPAQRRLLLWATTPPRRGGRPLDPIE